MRRKRVFTDLGNVVVHCDQKRTITMLMQLIGDAFASVDVDEAHKRVNLSPEGIEALRDFECGRLKPRQYQDRVIDLLDDLLKKDGSKKIRQYTELFWDAHCGMFTVNKNVISIWRNLQNRFPSLPLSALSNTDNMRWPIMCDLAKLEFSPSVLSYEVGAMKPDADIYEAALSLAGILPTNCFFVDDVFDNVVAALSHGMDVHHYNLEDMHRDERLAIAVSRFVEK